MIELEPGTILALTLVGGFVAVDGTSFGQFMISRPFVAAILGGWVAGAPAQGALIGLVLESFHLGVLPVGAAKYPEGGPAAVAAGAVYASVAPTASTLALVTLGALLLERLGGRTVHLMRLANVRVVSRGGALPTAENLEGRHLASIAIDFARGMFLVAFGLVLLGSTVPILDGYWGLDESTTGLLMMTFVVAMLASVIRMLGSKYWFAAAGAGIGLAALLLGG